MSPGRDAVRDRVYLSPPDITELEEQYVLDAVRSGWVAPLGPHVDAFERELADRVGAPHAVALSSGTAGLHLALVAWGIGPGDAVPTSTLTFAATANAITYTGATPVFVDCEPSTGNIDPSLLEEAVVDLRRQGWHVPAVVPVDLLGKCVDYEAVGEVARRLDVRVLCDAAESLGASSRGTPAGSWGDAAVLSFNGNKVMTTSGGGMLLSHDGELVERVRFLATQAREPAIHYEHREIGYNYRLSNILAALGRAQLSRLDEMVKTRREHRRLYTDLWSNVDGVEVLGALDDEEDNCWLTAVTVGDGCGWRAADLLEALGRDDIESRPLWKPMHLQPVYADRPAYLNGNSERLFAEGLTLPSGSALKGPGMDRVLDSVTHFLESAR